MIDFKTQPILYELEMVEIDDQFCHLAKEMFLAYHEPLFL